MHCISRTKSINTCLRTLLIFYFQQPIIQHDRIRVDVTIYSVLADMYNFNIVIHRTAGRPIALRPDLRLPKMDILQAHGHYWALTNDALVAQRNDLYKFLCERSLFGASWEVSNKCRISVISKRRESIKAHTTVHVYTIINTYDKKHEQLNSLTHHRRPLSQHVQPSSQTADDAGDVQDDAGDGNNEAHDDDVNAAHDTNINDANDADDAQVANAHVPDNNNDNNNNENNDNDGNDREASTSAEHTLSLSVPPVNVPLQAPLPTETSSHISVMEAADAQADSAAQVEALNDSASNEVVFTQASNVGEHGNEAACEEIDTTGTVTLDGSKKHKPRSQDSPMRKRAKAGGEQLTREEMMEMIRSMLVQMGGSVAQPGSNAGGSK